ncbi:ACP S-malonyltransferase [Dactylosporangium sp. NPDC051484]|uniref:ACP S-malonyltransferase n=1 Tax=Dactylosporangium sp. NPDC051484 TaxID=3154942 RepID=UPI003450E7DC
MRAATVFMFSGQGSQYHHMGRELFDTEPVFRAALERLDDIVLQESGRSVLATMYDPARSRSEIFDDTGLTHPAIVMVELALAETLIAHDVRPDLLLGSSLGEYTAATLAGVIDERSCLRLLVGQARAVTEGHPGGMIAVLAGEELFHRTPQLHQHTELAGRNYAEHFVVAGPPEGLAVAEAWMRDTDVLHQRIPVRHPFHSRWIDSARAAYEPLLDGLVLAPPSLPVISCATGGRLDRFTREHLWRLARDPIEFATTIAALEASGGPYLYLDLGPSGTLHNFVRANLSPQSESVSHALLSPYHQDPRVISTIRSVHRDRPRRRQDGVGMTGPHRTPVVFGFPGQGAQVKGMGRDLFDRFPDEVAAADAVLGYSVQELCLRNPDGRLRETRYTQPALYVVEALSHLARLADEPDRPDYLVGHSLGEYTALFAAGVFDFETGLRLVRRRGELMSSADPGAMAAVIGCDQAAVEEILSDPALSGVDLANQNAPDQFALAGPAEQLALLSEAAGARGGRVVMLNVSASFHSRYMAAAAQEFARFLDGFRFADPSIPVIANTTARPYPPGGVRDLLARQLASPVRWSDTVRYLMREAPGFTFQELGPGRTLTKLVDRIRSTADPLPPAPPSAPAANAYPPPSATRPVESPPPSSATVTVRVAGGDVGGEQSPPPAPSPVVVSQPWIPGAATFRGRYGLRHAYVTGSMYGGISGGEFVCAVAKAGALGVVGTGGASVAAAADLVTRARESGAQTPLAANLLYRHGRPDEELALVDEFLRLGVDVVEASGFPHITPALVKFKLKGGRVLAKVSRTDVAAAFLTPPPAGIVADLRATGAVSPAEAGLADRPVADDLCVEADAGWIAGPGSLSTLLPAIVALRDELASHPERVHVGAAGGIGTPRAAAAALLLGAEFLLTGSINQATVEAATSDHVKDLLTTLDVQDVEAAPWPDMFELGVRAWVARRGVMLPARANVLYGLWRHHGSWDAIDADTRRQIETRYLRRPYPEAVRRWGAPPGGPDDPRQELARVVRGYLNEGLHLARDGDPARQVDYLVYCGPAMGAFNRWVRGTGLAHWRARGVQDVTEHLLESTLAVLREWTARLTPMHKQAEQGMGERA